MEAVASNPAPRPVDGARGRALTWVALVCVALSAAVFVRRGHAAIQAAVTPPGVAVTSGFEEESLFAVWRAAHGQPVYGDVLRLPYASAYFNWLFYAAYAQPVRVALPLHGDAVIPLAGRLMTAAGAMAGALALLLLLRRVLAGRLPVAAALTTFVFFGPLLGWWTLTVRPDVWALTLECSALAVLLLHYRRKPLGTAAVATLLFYGAWAFKQTYVLGLGAALLFLLFRRQWRPAGLLAFGSLGLWLATFLLLGPSYRAATLGTASTNAYLAGLGLRNFDDMVLRSAPLWLLAAPAIFRLRPAARPASPALADDTRILGRLGLLIALPLSIAAGCKIGATSNYYFTTQVMLSLLAASFIATASSLRRVLAGLLAVAVMQLLTLLGYAGLIDLSGQTQRMGAIWQVWQRQPAPRFSSLTSLNLPWLNAGSPPLVLAFNYRLERAAGRTLERDGVGGLIREGYFQALLLPAATGQEYDGASLTHYHRGATIGGMAVFHRDPAATQ